MTADPLLESFAHLVRTRGPAPLVASAERAVTVAMVEALSRLAEQVLPPDLEPGRLVGLAVPDGPAFLAALLALRRRRLPALLLDARTRAVEQARVAARLGATSMLFAETAWPDGGQPFRLRQVEGSFPCVLDPATAVVKLTSGSTGEARGIATPVAALLADDAALARSMGLGGPEEHVLAGVPFSHSYGLSSIVMPALVRGSLLVMADPGAPFALLPAAHSLEATFFPTVPAYLEALVKLPRLPAWAASLRLVISAGAPLKAATAERFQALFGQPVHVFYGASETGGIGYDREGGAALRGTLGTPVDGVRVTLAPPAGLVTVESPAVAATYLPEPSPALADGHFTTSDLGKWQNGELVLCGRADDLINVRGKKVNPREIETVLLALPGVEDAAVFGVASDDGAQRIRAVVAVPGGGLRYAAVQDFCRAHLAEHKVPRSIVVVPALPRTSRGKLDRAALLALMPEAGW